jgi:hypothetical protein
MQVAFTHLRTRLCYGGLCHGGAFFIPTINRMGRFTCHCIAPKSAPVISVMSGYGSKES